MKFSIALLGFTFALHGALAAPIRERAIETVTFIETVTEIVHTTSTVWVLPTDYAPEPAPTHESDKHEDKYSSAAELVAATSTTSTTSTTPTTSTTSTTSTTPITSTSTTSTTPTPTPTTSTSTPTSISTTSTTPPPQPPTTKKAIPSPSPYTPSLVESIPPISIPSTSIDLPTPTPIEVPSATPTPPPAAPPVVIPSPPIQAPALVSNDGNISGNTGSATFYDVGMGSCGIQSKDTDLIVALSYLQMGLTYNANPNMNIQCGEKIACQQVPTPSNPNPPIVTVTVVDTCPSCPKNDIDFSRSAYAAMGCTEVEGRCNFNWKILG